MVPSILIWKWPHHQIEVRRIVDHDEVLAVVEQLGIRNPGSRRKRPDRIRFAFFEAGKPFALLHTYSDDPFVFYLHGPLDRAVEPGVRADSVVTFLFGVFEPEDEDIARMTRTNLGMPARFSRTEIAAMMHRMEPEHIESRGV